MWMSIYDVPLLCFILLLQEKVFCAQEEYDVVIVGAGPAGVVAASKLAQSGKKSVLLLEQGGPLSGRVGGDLFPDESFKNPDGLTKFDIPGDGDEITFQEITSSLRSLVPAGEPPFAFLMRGLGGSGMIGANQYQQAPDDYLDMAFPKGWQSDDLKDYYGHHTKQLKEITSKDGKVYLNDVLEIIDSAAKTRGINKLHDSSRTDTVGYGRAKFLMTDDFQRGGPTSLFLEQFLDENGNSNLKNLDIEYFSDVRQINFTEATDGNDVRATSVRYNKFGSINDVNIGNIQEARTARVKPTGIVISAAGALVTPLLLMRSGIYNNDIQAPSFFPRIMENRNLGLLTDHVATRLVFAVQNTSAFEAYYFDNDFEHTDDVSDFLKSRKGPYSQFSAVFHMTYLSKTGELLEIPDIHFLGHPYGAYDPDSRTQDSPLAQENNFEVFVIHRNPISRVLLSVDSTGNHINFPVGLYLPDGTQDHDDMVHAIIDFLNIMQSADSKYDLALVNGPPCFPDGCDENNAQAVEDANTFVNTEAAIIIVRDDSVHSSFLGYNCYMGTCPMSQDDDNACVDSKDLRLKGTENVHILDASVIPNVPVYPLATIMAVAEKAADILDETIPGTFTAGNNDNDKNLSDNSSGAGLVALVVILVFFFILFLIWAIRAFRRKYQENEKGKIHHSLNTPLMDPETKDGTCKSQQSSQDQQLALINVTDYPASDDEKEGPESEQKVRFKEPKKQSPPPPVSPIPEPPDLEQQESEDVYSRIEGKYRGLALVIGNGNFGKVQKSCHKDANEMAKLLKKAGYKVENKKDMKNADIITQCLKMSLKDHSKFDSFVFYFSGHGGNEIIYGHDVDMKNDQENAQSVAISGITEFFEPHKCKTLVGKPKVFLWDCCRGNNIDKNIKGWGDINVGPKPFNPPKFDDFLYGYSSAASYVAYPGDTKTKGLSVWTYYLAQRLTENHTKHEPEKKHFADVLVRVQRDVNKHVREKKRNKQSSNHLTYLQKDFYLM